MSLASDVRQVTTVPLRHVGSGDDGGVKSRIMYVELKTGFNDNGPAWIGRVAFSKTGRTIYYRGKSLRRIPGGGVSGNYRDIATGEEYWISGVKRTAKIGTGQAPGQSRSTTTSVKSTNASSADRDRTALPYRSHDTGGA